MDFLFLLGRPPERHTLIPAYPGLPPWAKLFRSSGAGFCSDILHSFHTGILPSPIITYHFVVVPIVLNRILPIPDRQAW